MHKEEKSIMFVVNPRSAGGRTMKRWKNTEIMLKSERVGGYHVAYTSKVAEATQITREAIKEGYQHIIAVGGDGTTNEVLNGFYENGQKIAASSYFSFLATGTGSDFQRMFPDHDYKEAIFSIIRRERIIHCDTVRVTYTSWDKTGESRYYINTADLGIGAETCMRVNQNSKQLGGFLTFLSAAIRTLFAHQNFQAQVLVDGIKVFSGSTPEIVAANGRFFGGGIMIAPEAEIGDGLLDLIIIEDISKGKFLLSMPAAYRGKHIRQSCVKTYQGRRVDITCSQAVPLETDGETPGTSNASFEILPGDILLAL
jgi:diacylglycerol kinase (ATP)